ncbi:MAG TPA: NAD-dependent succinate-semialdehyde dehydrogenase [Kofleriaceae bacterium]|nr:NAD-dependent succinate-semialdehyde dehydrogenase [Kofleriaceae bacterium]
MKTATDAFIDGRWVAGSQCFAVRDPYDDALVAEVADCREAEIDEAIDAAARAFPAWRATPAPERGKRLAALAASMLADEQRLADLCTRENGKARKEALAEVRYAASFFEWFAGEAGRVYGETIPGSRPEQRIVVTREPVGPCALITPWNFPYAMLTRKVGAALAAGCTVVAKPAELTPLGALAIAQHGEHVGIPPGVINVVPTTTSKRCGARMLASPKIKKLSFTGSTAVGRELLRAAADDIKRVSLELGGNAPFVVLADADLDAAVAGTMIAKFRNGGQSCVAANRFIVERDVVDAYIARLLPVVSKLVTGRGLDDTTDLGPLVDNKSVAKVRHLVDDAIAKGATMLHDSPIRGRLVGPIVLGDITPAMELWREEIFGPVLAIRTANDEADALAQANDTEYGLVSYVYTRDGARQQRFVEGLESGMVGVNTGLVSTAQAPFGGIKQSGIGREGSRHGLDDYTNLKYTSLTF